MNFTGVDPITGKPVQVARHLRDRKLQRALMQFFKPANRFDVREALVEAGRTDLIGTACDALNRPEIGVWAILCRFEEPLPTMPLRLTGDTFVPVEFELSYTEAYRRLKVPR